MSRLSVNICRTIQFYPNINLILEVSCRAVHDITRLNSLMLGRTRGEQDNTQLKQAMIMKRRQGKARHLLLLRIESPFRGSRLCANGAGRRRSHPICIMHHASGTNEQGRTGHWGWGGGGGDHRRSKCKTGNRPQ